MSRNAIRCVFLDMGKVLPDFDKKHFNVRESMNRSEESIVSAECCASSG